MARKWTKPLEWQNQGTEPSEQLKREGFTGGYKPAAGTFNYLLNTEQKCLEELQGAVDEVELAAIDESTRVDEALEGKANKDLSNVDTISIEKGGTGADTPEKARESLGVAAVDLSNVEDEKMKAAVKNSGFQEGTKNILDGSAQGSVRTAGSAIETDDYKMGENSYAEGEGTKSIGTHSHAEGFNTLSKGYAAHAEGNMTTANGTGVHAEGYKTTAYKNAAHIEGYSYKQLPDDVRSIMDTKGTNQNVPMEDRIAIKEIWDKNSFSLAGGMYSHVEGQNCLAFGDGSHAEGNCTLALDFFSHAGGAFTIANRYQTAIGKYNIESAGPVNNGDRTGDIFLIGNGASDIRSNAMRVDMNGSVYGLSDFSASGADYAEYFEWFDGNIANEDRRGLFVTLDGEKIRKANADDEYILGIVSAFPAIRGDSQSEIWKDMYLTDVFGEKLTEIVEVEETVDEDTGEVIPAHTEERWILNPDYDPSQEYIRREERKEWSPVGLVGKLVVVDDGTCEVNGYCKVGIDGKGTKSKAVTPYRVMSRLDETHIRVFIR